MRTPLPSLERPALGNTLPTISTSPTGSEATWNRASQVAVLGLFVIAILWSCYVAQHVIVPILLAWVIATIVLPLVKWLQDRGVSRAAAATCVTLLFLLLIAALVILLSAPVASWLGRASQLGSLLRERLESFSHPLALLQELQKGLGAIEGSGTKVMKVEQQSASMVSTILGVLTPAITQFLLFLGALIFYLIYRDQLRATVVHLVSHREGRLTTLRALNEIDDNMTTYFGTFTLVNVGLGVVATVLTWATGLPNPFLWGVLACVLNYIPYIGPAIMIGTLAVVGLFVHPNLGAAVVAPLLYLATVTLEGHFLTPAVMGQRLELNPFAIFLAIAFCAWLWGPMGAFLAVPLLMALSVVVTHAWSEEKPIIPK
jgi:predicted PurR-regulated permease PerM